MKPWKFDLRSGWPFLDRNGRYRYSRNSSKIKKQLKKIISKKRRKIQENLSNVKIFSPYRLDDDWYGKHFHKRN